MKLRNAAVLITAGGDRIGLALAKQSIALGLDVVLHYRSTDAPARRWLRSSPELRNRVAFLQADLTDAGADIVAEAKAAAPKLQGLVNNASIFTKGNLTDGEHLRTTLGINTFVPLTLCTTFKELIGTGWIVNITDAHVIPVHHQFQNYRISKIMLGELTRQTASLFAPHIRVNAIAPGAILPSPSEKRKNEFRALAKLIPLGRTGDLAAVCRAYAYLVESTYVTGQTLYVDGGWHLSAGESSLR